VVGTAVMMSIPVTELSNGTRGSHTAIIQRFAASALAAAAIR
jgi:hypothetical protein